MSKDRTDQSFGESVGELGNSLLGPGFKNLTSGWLSPEAAWSFYWGNGTVRQIINRFTTLMVKAGYDYTGADIKYNWGPVASALETKRLEQQMRLCAVWAFVFGGGAIEHIVDDSDRSREEPLKLENVRAYKGMRVWSAYDLRPVHGRNYKTAEWFVPRYRGDNTKIHRSRLSIMVSTEVPVTNLGSSLFINQRTGWPPSWLEGVYDPFCDWARAHANATQIMKSKSILHLLLSGYELVSQSPDSAEAQALSNNLTQILNDLDNTGILVTDVNSKLAEVERSLAGISDVLKSKAIAAASAFGTPMELFDMVSSGSTIGTNSAPYDAYNDMVDGWRVVMTTPVIERATNIQLAVESYTARIKQEDPAIPTEYTVVHRPIQDQNAAENAERRKNESLARKNDSELVSQEVIQSDPSLARDYPGLQADMDDRAEAAELAKAASIEAEVDDPAGEDMVSAQEVARKVNLSSTTINKMANAGALPGRKIAGRWKFYLSRVIAAIKGLSTPVDQLDARWDGVRTDNLGLSDSTKFGDSFGASVAMREIFEVLERVADSDLAVMLLGETGTGKEGIARGLHRGGKFVAVNCAALPKDPQDLVAFVAGEMKKARGGTLFLDEIGDLPRVGQSALLVELGNSDARLVSATSLDVRDASKFRPDLLHRLAAVEVEIPPLRDREADVHELAHMFYAERTKAAGIEPATPPFTEAALAAMLAYPWPGNVRELVNAVARGVQLASHAKSVGPEHLQLRMTGRG